MTFADLTKERYSSRSYTDEPVSEEDIESILEAGRIAPTAKNLQPVRVIVADTPESIARIGKAAGPYGATVALIVVANTSKASAVQALTVASKGATVEFFAKVQNKLHYAVHRHTAAELIVERADAQKEHMGLTSWENAPDGKIVKTDVSIAKNYLTERELEDLGRIVNAYLDLAERRAKRRIPMTMADWARHLDRILIADDMEILQDAGKISAEIAREYAENEFEKYRVIQDRLFKSDFDRQMELFEGQEGEEK